MPERPEAAGTTLAEELRNIVAEAEELLRAFGDGDASRLAQDAASMARSYMQRNPWTAIAIGAGAGLLIGALLGPSPRAASSQSPGSALQ
jgi:ElaB/YqjD/DUF883 family membrane-anchored ribosome-binding protein